MVNLETIIVCQKQGVDLLTSLTTSERESIDSLCEYACPQIIQEAVKQKAPIQKAVTDSFLYGIALGLKLQIVNGELRTR